MTKITIAAVAIICTITLLFYALGGVDLSQCEALYSTEYCLVKSSN